MPEEEKSSSGNHWSTGLAVVAGVYFGFFGLILLDELVLDTRWINDWPEPVLNVLGVIYSPLIKIVQYFL